MQAIARAQVVFLADFHALKQSQRSQLRILRELESSADSLILGVEFIDAAYQRELDLYLSGDLSEKEFLQRIYWTQNWGFDWDHYKPLLQWAVKHNVYVRALNRSFAVRSQRSLRERDRFSGEIVADLVTQFPLHKIVVIYGDLHLAPEHLPREIQKNVASPLKFCFVYQNSEDLYFKMLKQKRDEDVLKLGPHSYCLMSVTPWVKWQNYLLYLEHSADTFFEDEEDSDYTDHVAHFVRFIAQELEMPCALDELVVYSARDEIFWDKISESYSEKETRKIRRWVSEEKSFYLPDLPAAFLVRPTVNHASSLAMRFLLSQCRERAGASGYTGFLEQVFIEAWVYFGTKIVNPKRKTDTLADLQHSLNARSSGDKGAAVLKLCLAQRMFEMLYCQGVYKQPPRIPRSAEVVNEAAKKMGGIVGEKIYILYGKQGMTRLDIKNLLTRPFDFEVYMDLMKRLDGVNLTFKSKRDKL